MSGVKPPLLFVHGAWHGGWCWENLFRYFAERGYDCHTLDLSGHGERPRPEGFSLYGLGSFLNDFERFPVDPAEAVLIGHSVGGLLLQRYLATRRARGAALLAPVPPNGIPWRSIFKIIGHSIPQTLNLMTHPYDISATDLPRLFFFDADTPQELVDRNIARICPESPFLIWRISLLGKLHAWRYPYDGRTPVMLVAGGRDYFFGPRDLASLAAYYRARFIVEDDLPHNLMSVPGWERVAAGLENWIETLP